MALFTVDWEDWNHGIHLAKGSHSSLSMINDILELLEKYKVKAIFYMLGRCFNENREIYETINLKGHTIGFHGEYHDYGEQKSYEGNRWGPYRSPYFSLEGIPKPPAGGFFFRIMPIWYLKWAIKKSGVFWIHPHDLDENHPKIRNPIMNWKRHVGLKTARKKLECLLKEVLWDEPSKD